MEGKKMKTRIGKRESDRLVRSHKQSISCSYLFATTSQPLEGGIFIIQHVAKRRASRLQDFRQDPAVNARQFLTQHESDGGRHVDVFNQPQLDARLDAGA